MVSETRGEDMVVMGTSVIPDHIAYLIRMSMAGEYDGKMDFPDRDVTTIHITPYDERNFPYFKDVDRVYIAFKKGVVR